MVENRGGKRKGAGRKTTGITETKVIRVDSKLVPLVEGIKKQFKESGIIPTVTLNQSYQLQQIKEVTTNQSNFEELQEAHKTLRAKYSSEIAALTVKAAGRDNENLIAEIDSLNAANKTHQQTIRSLKSEIDSLKGMKAAAKAAATKGRTQSGVTSTISIADEIAPTYGKELSDKVRSLKIKKAVSALGVDLQGKTIKYAPDYVKIQVIEWIKANKP